jgi:hypothetical protein
LWPDRRGLIRTDLPFEVTREASWIPILKNECDPDVTGTKHGFGTRFDSSQDRSGCSLVRKLLCDDSAQGLIRPGFVLAYENDQRTFG